MQNDIETVRAQLAAKAAGQPPAVRGAIANLDRWLEVLTEPHDGVDAAACALKAVDALERTLGW